jgi:hypothetical protein
MRVVCAAGLGHGFLPSSLPQPQPELPIDPRERLPAERVGRFAARDETRRAGSPLHTDDRA